MNLANTIPHCDDHSCDLGCVEWKCRCGAENTDYDALWWAFGPTAPTDGWKDQEQATCHRCGQESQFTKNLNGDIYVNPTPRA